MSERLRRELAGGWLALAGLLALAGFVYAQALDAATNYDEGVYLASVDAVRHGQQLGSEVEASQPPGFYALLEAVWVLAGRAASDVRLGFLALALLGLVAAYAIGHRLAAIPGGIGAAALLAITAPYPVQAARVQSDTASVVLALASLALLMAAGSRAWRAAAAGALLGAALSVKLLVAPAVVPAAILLTARGTWRTALAFAGGAAAVWAALVARHAGSLGDLWRTVVVDHRAARALGPPIADNAERVLLHPLDWATPAGVLVPLGLVCAALLVHRVEMVALWAWIAASAAFLVWQVPLFDHHLVLLATALAVPAGIGLGAAWSALPARGRAVTAGAAALALAAGLVQEGRRLARLEDGEPPAVRWAAAQIASEVPSDDLVGTDLPIVPYLARRRVPGQLADSSYVRLRGGALTGERILETLERDGVRVVVVGREWRNDRRLVVALAARYPDRKESGGVTIARAP